LKFVELFGPSIETLEISTFYQCTEPAELNFYQQLTSLKSIRIKTIPALEDSETGKYIVPNEVSVIPNCFKRNLKSASIEFVANTFYHLNFMEELNVETLSYLKLPNFSQIINGADKGPGFNLLTLCPQYEGIIPMDETDMDIANKELISNAFDFELAHERIISAVE